MNIEARFSGAGPVDRELSPVVPLPRSGVPGAVIALGALLVAVLLFLYLNGRRNEATSAAQQPEAADGAAFAAPPPPLAVPAPLPPQPQVIAIPPPPPPFVAPAARSTQPAPAPQREPFYAPPPPLPLPLPADGAGQPYPGSSPQSGLAPPAPLGSTEPALLGDPGEISADGGPPAAATGSTASQAGQLRPGDAQTYRLSKLPNRTSIIPTGTMIPAVLETPIDTSRPGLVRAIVSQDARGFDGRRILVPRGSRLVGEFRGEARSGQKRVLVNWTRLLRPDGSSVKLDSPAADSLGGSGVPGVSHSYFLERFLSGAFQSAVSVGEAVLGRQTRTTVVVAAPAGSAAGLAQAFGSPTGPQPRITVGAGAIVNVFVAHDLDFSSGERGR